MVNQQLVDYVRQYRAQYTVPQLKQTLVSQGYNAVEVDEAIKFAIGPQVSAQSVPVMQAPASGHVAVSQIIKKALVPSLANGGIKAVFLFAAALIGPSASLWGYVFKFMSGLVLGLIVAILVVEYGMKIPLGKDIEEKAFYYFVLIDVVLLIVFSFSVLLASIFAFVIGIFGVALADFLYAKMLVKKF
jgi:hypothetical protein